MLARLQHDRRDRRPDQSRAIEPGSYAVAVELVSGGGDAPALGRVKNRSLFDQRILKSGVRLLEAFQHGFPQAAAAAHAKRDELDPGSRPRRLRPEAPPIELGEILGEALEGRLVERQPGWDGPRHFVDLTAV